MRIIKSTTDSEKVHGGDHFIKPEKQKDNLFSEFRYFCCSIFEKKLYVKFAFHFPQENSQHWVCFLLFYWEMKAKFCGQPSSFMQLFKYDY